MRSLWQCGPTLDFTPINSYQGEFADIVQEKEDAVVLIDGRCTGTLIEASGGPVVVTAGHCVGLGDRSLLVFNFEDDPDGIIQHPRGRRKVIAEGGFLASCNQLVYDTDLDTLVGSSGAGVLNRQGHLLGLHTDGDCDEQGRGANRGLTAEALVEASPYLPSTDIADR